MLICNYSKEYQSSGVSLPSCWSSGGMLVSSYRLPQEYSMNKEEKLGPIRGSLRV